MDNALTEPVVPYAEASVRFRLADQSDRSALLELCAAYRRVDSQPQASDLVAQALDAALAGDSLIRLFMIELLEESEQPSEHAALLVGYVAISLGFSIEAGGRDAFVDELYVEPPFQRRGLGKHALGFAEKLCRELGVRRICLEVERKNERARKLYEQLGFRDHERYLLSHRLD